MELTVIIKADSIFKIEEVQLNFKTL